MKTKMNKFSEVQIKSLAQFLGNCGTGSDITNILKSCNLDNNSGASTK